MQKRLFFYILMASVIAQLISGCTDSPNIVSISVENGGDIYSNKGQLVLSIPEEAVVEGIKVELIEHATSLQPENERLGSKAFQFVSTTDDNLTSVAILSLPVTLDVPNNHSVLVAELRNGHWFAMPGTDYNLELKIATAHIYAFSTYAVIFRPITKKTYSIGAACDQSSTQQTTSFVHVADLHSNFGLDDRYSKISAYYKRVISDNPYTLFTNAGDDYEKGSVAEHRSSGLATVEATKAMAFDVRVIGNHDFAWGKEQLLDFANDPHGVVLGSNVLYQETDYANFPALEYVEVEVGCLKLGMFSLVASPWNEFDRPYTGDYLEYVRLDFWWKQVAQRLINEHRSEVDLMVLVSHLGLEIDEGLASSVNGIDIILGGHSHQGVRFSTDINNTLVLQPEFYAHGLTQLDIRYDRETKQIVYYNHSPILMEDLVETDPSITAKIETIMTKYAPEAHVNVAQLKNDTPIETIVEIAAKAAIYAHVSDAALIDKNLAWKFWNGWNAGGLTQQNIQHAYRQERQKPDTPGFNSLYKTKVTGGQLTLMRQAQPEWYYLGVEPIDSNQEYTVILHKAPALHPELYFGDGSVLIEPEFMSETYVAIEQYAHYRTSECLFLDSDERIVECTPKKLIH